MNGLIRKLAVLAVLWSVCELLMPEGKQQQMVRAAVSVLVLTALLSAAGIWLRGEQAVLPAVSQQGWQASQDQYRRTALTAFANQAKSWCEAFCRRAGYEAQAEVSLHMDGSLDSVMLTLTPQTPLMDTQQLADRLAQELNTERERVQIAEES